MLAAMHETGIPVILVVHATTPKLQLFIDAVKPVVIDLDDSANQSSSRR